MRTKGKPSWPFECALVITLLEGAEHNTCTLHAVSVFAV
jgi:hypothetical protein